VLSFTLFNPAYKIGVCAALFLAKSHSDLYFNRVREAKTGVSAKSLSPFTFYLYPFPFYLKVEKLKL
jgi:hypothetical protein